MPVPTIAIRTKVSPGVPAMGAADLGEDKTAAPRRRVWTHIGWIVLRAVPLVGSMASVRHVHLLISLGSDTVIGRWIRMREGRQLVYWVIAKLPQVGEGRHPRRTVERLGPFESRGLAQKARDLAAVSLPRAAGGANRSRLRLQLRSTSAPDLVLPAICAPDRY